MTCDIGILRGDAEVFLDGHGKLQRIDGIEPKALRRKQRHVVADFGRIHFEHQAGNHHLLDAGIQINVGHRRNNLLVSPRTLNQFPMSHNPEKLRLDALLVARGFFESRERAQRALMAGLVQVDGQPAGKPGQRVREDVEITVKGTEKYVGRGALKLEAALDAFGIDPAGRVCLDIGASTGGFTDCLLQRGAARVYAFDVGRNQLHWRIRNDGRVIAKEGINCRYLSFDDVGERVSLVVADVSFISLTLILPPAFELLEPDGMMVVLIKPQFELSREAVGRGGVVTDPAAHEEAVRKIRDFTEGELRHRWVGHIESPILGATGNREFLACLRP